MAISQLWKKYFWEDLDLNLLVLLFHDPFALFLLSLLLSLLLIPLLHYKYSSKGKPNLPPSPPRLPVIGNLHQLGKFPHRSLRSLADKYGPVMLLKLGQVPALVVSSPDLVAEIANTHDILFSSRPKTMATDVLLYGTNNIGFAPYGKYWRQARKICVVELLSLKRVQSFQFVREEEVEMLVNRVKTACVKGTTINLSQMMTEASNNIMSRCILGQSFKKEDGSISRIGELASVVAMELMAFSVGDFFPYLKWIDVMRGFVARLRSTFRQLDAFNNRLIQEHKEMKSSDYGGNSDHIKDFVDILLTVQQDSTLDFALTHEQLKAIIQDMFTAGSETSSIVTEWIMAELLRHPGAMKKAQEEARKVVGKKEKVDMSDVNQMKYLQNVVKEAMRLHPPAPLLVPRETTASVKMGTYNIPAKTRVLINAWAIQRNPSLWERPEDFIPERFETSSVDFGSQDFKLIPFGFGRRRCPGLALGVANVEYLVANLLCWFDWKLPHDAGLLENIDMSEVYGLTVRKKFPLHVIPMVAGN